MECPIHVIVPDTQVKPNVPTDHLAWIGEFLVQEFWGHPNLKWIHLGDHADMESLSSYDKGKKAMEGRRYLADILAANNGFRALNAPLADANKVRQSKWQPKEKIIVLGNHEDRITRAIESDAQLDGLLSLDALNYAEEGWEVVPFLKPRFVDGVAYVHYVSNPMTGKPLGGVATTRLKNVGYSFTMGHQQTLDYAQRFVRDKDGQVSSQHALVAGACYLHDEGYKGWQGNAHWRGIIVKRFTAPGQYDPQFISLDYLRMRFDS